MFKALYRTMHLKMGFEEWDVVVQLTLSLQESQSLPVAIPSVIGVQVVLPTSCCLPPQKIYHALREDLCK